MAKKLNEEIKQQMINELKGASSFFPKEQDSSTPVMIDNQPSESPALTEKATPKSEAKPNGRTVHTNGVSERADRTVKPNDSSELLSSSVQTTEEKKPTFMEEVDSPEIESSRPTQRYSFEVYRDQRKLIEEIKYLYERKTGKRLSSSRILRDLIDKYLTSIADELRK